MFFVCASVPMLLIIAIILYRIGCTVANRKLREHHRGSKFLLCSILPMLQHAHTHSALLRVVKGLVKMWVLERGVLWVP